MGILEAMIPRLDEIRKINHDLWEHVGGRKGIYARRCSATLKVGNCCALPFDSEAADIAVSSPPYFIAYDYAKLLRVTSWWILGKVPDGAGHVEVTGRGKPVADVAPPELGGIFRKAFRCASRRLDAEASDYSASHVKTLVRSLPPFFDGIRRALSEFFRVLRSRGKLCLVLGNTRHCGVTVPTAEIAAELALMQGFRPVAIHVRRQHSATQPQARDASGQFTSEERPDQYSYRDEYIVILRKP